MKKRLLFRDTGGSMTAFEEAGPATAIDVEDTFKFYNVPREYVYGTNPIEVVNLVNKSKDHVSEIFIVSDAGAARGHNSSIRVSCTKQFLKMLDVLDCKITWLNPMPISRWTNTSAERIEKFVYMKPMDTSTHILKDVKFAKNRVAYFAERYGDDHLLFARLAAEFKNFTVDLLYALINRFLPNAPNVVVSDLIMSSLCTPVRYRTYAIHEEDRGMLRFSNSADVKSILNKFEIEWKNIPKP